jgi:hypothetical protein
MSEKPDPYLEGKSKVKLILSFGLEQWFVFKIILSKEIEALSNKRPKKMLVLLREYQNIALISFEVIMTYISFFVYVSGEFDGAFMNNIGVSLKFTFYSFTNK